MIPEGGKETKSQKKLNHRQALFVANYIKSGNGRLACEQSGYTNKDLSGTAYQLLRNPRIIKEIEAKKANLHTELLKDRSTFLAEVTSLKQLCLDSKRIGDLVKLLNLEAEVLNLKKPDNQQQINIFSAMDSAKAFLNAQEGGEKKETIEDIAQAEIVEPVPTTAQTSDMPVCGEDTQSEPVNDIHI